MSLFPVSALTAAVCGAAVEVVAIITALALYPSGMSDDRETADARPGPPSDGTPPVRRLRENAVAGGTPVLLVHGMSSNRGIFYILRRKLQREGFLQVTMLNYNWLATDVRSAARLLAEEVERLCDSTGHERVHVIGHSLGGLVARYYVQRMGGDARVHTVITLGAPHQGTLAAMLPLPHPVIRQLRPGSDVLAELAEPAPGCGTRFVAFHSELDELIIPASNARLVHPNLQVTNVAVRALGHVSLPLHPSVVREVCRVLHDEHLQKLPAVA
ncbi:MAG: triacylglycerol lipase [Streptomycetaceae bacterium]|nr:triacylglycerol lipase [Streptomycetaceae bacterium]